MTRGQLYACMHATVVCVTDTVAVYSVTLPAMLLRTTAVVVGVYIHCVSEKNKTPNSCP